MSVTTSNKYWSVLAIVFVGGDRRVSVRVVSIMHGTNNYNEENEKKEKNKNKCLNESVTRHLIEPKSPTLSDLLTEKSAYYTTIKFRSSAISTESIS